MCEMDVILQDAFQTTELWLNLDQEHSLNMDSAKTNPRRGHLPNCLEGGMG